MRNCVNIINDKTFLIDLHLSLDGHRYEIFNVPIVLTSCTR